MFNMFKKFGLAGVFVGILLASTTANAILIVDTIDQNVKVGWFKSYKYTHDLTDNNFIPGTTTAAYGDIDILFSDDGDFLPEVIKIKLNGIKVGKIFSATSFLTDLKIETLAQINQFGKLDVKIKSKFGDFFVGKSVLSVYTNDASNGVPAPGILGMLGLGLLGIGIAGRRRKT